MTYKLIIEYVKNTDPTSLKHVGKATLLDKSDNKVFSKRPVAIPAALDLASLPYADLCKKLSVIHAEINSDLKAFDTDKVYTAHYKDLVKDNFSDFIKNDKEILFISTSNVLDHRDNKAFIMSPEDFREIQAVVQNKETLTVEIQEKWFFWFPKKLQSEVVTHINTIYNRFMNKAVALQVLKDEADKKNQQAKPVGVVSSAVNHVESVVPKTKNPIQHKQTQVVRKSQNVQSHYRYNDDSDPLNILLAFTNPNLAVFMRPQSLLAWAMYMNSMNNMEHSSVENSLNQINGFDDLSGKYKETTNGYVVDLYNNSGDYVGDIKFDYGSNSYEATSTDGQINTLNVNNDRFDFGVNSPESSPLSINLVRTEDGFVGNWYSENNTGIAPVNAGVVIGNDFNVSSTPDKLNDLDKFDFGNSSSSVSSKDTFDFGVDSKVSEDTSPPQPVITEPVMSSWTSSDPYNNN